MYRVLLVIIVLGSFGCKNCQECKLIFEDNLSQANLQCIGLQNTFPEFSTTSVVDLGTDCDDLFVHGKIESETITLTDCNNGNNVVATSKSTISCVKID